MCVIINLESSDIMTKIVCDFNALDELTSKLDSDAEELLKLLNNADAYAKKTLVWEGPARDSFDASFLVKCNTIENNILELKNVSAFLKVAKTQIEAAESTLSELKI